MQIEKKTINKDITSKFDKITELNVQFIVHPNHPILSIPETHNDSREEQLIN